METWKETDALRRELNKESITEHSVFFRDVPLCMGNIFVRLDSYQAIIISTVTCGGVNCVHTDNIDIILLYTWSMLETVSSLYIGYICKVIARMRQCV